MGKQTLRRKQFPGKMRGGVGREGGRERRKERERKRGGKEGEREREERGGRGKRGRVGREGFSYFLNLEVQCLLMLKYKEKVQISIKHLICQYQRMFLRDKGCV